MGAVSSFSMLFVSCRRERTVSWRRLVSFTLMRLVMMVRKIMVLFLLVIWGIFPQVAPADIYKYVDEEGVIHLTNVPTVINAQYVLVLKERPVHFAADTDISKYNHLIEKAAGKYGVSPALVKAVIKAESNFNHRAVSPVGARGLMQLMSATASYLQVADTFHPEHNIDGGVRYLRYLLNLYQNDLPLALAAYNAGEGAVSRYSNRIPPYRETQSYVRRVISYFNSYLNNGK